jgi:hypothetical protein
MDRHRITPVIGSQNLCPTLHEALRIVGAARPPSTA